MNSAPQTMVNEADRPSPLVGQASPRRRLTIEPITRLEGHGKELYKFAAQQYLDFVAEHVEPWSYMRFTFLKPRGWGDLAEGPDTSIYSVAPLARLNAADGMATPRAQAAYEEFYQTLGGKPVHHTLANHWARVIEMIYAAKGLIRNGNVSEGLLNKVEMAFRAYDPCLGCATHALPGHLPLQVNIYDSRRSLLHQLVQD